MSIAVSPSFGGKSVITNGLMVYYDTGHYSSYIGSGTALRDLSTLAVSNTATLVNSPSFGTQSGQGVLNYNAVNLAVRPFANVPNIGYTASLSIVAMVQRSGNQNTYSGLVFSRNPAIINSAVGLSTGGFTPQANSNVSYSWYDNSNTWNFESNLQLPNNTWCMIGLVVTANTFANLYLNNNYVTNTSPRNVALLSNVAIGSDINFAGPARNFTGNIGPVLIYNRALTQDEMNVNYQALRTKYGV